MLPTVFPLDTLGTTSPNGGPLCNRGAYLFGALISLLILSISCSSGSGVSEAGKGRVIALDARSGDELWQVEVANALVSAPALAGSRLIVKSMHYCNVDSSGTAFVWVTTLDAQTGETLELMAVEEENPEPCVRAPSMKNTSTTFTFVLGDVNAGGGDLIAADKVTGHTKWYLDLPGPPSEGFYDLSVIPGEQVVLYKYLSRSLERPPDSVLADKVFEETPYTKVVVAVDAENGAGLWTRREERAFGSVVPLERVEAFNSGDAVFITYFGDSGNDTYGGRLDVVDAMTGVLRWQYESDVFSPTASVATDDELVVVAGGEEAIALKLMNGAQIWERQLSGHRHHSTAVTIAHGTAYIALSGQAPGSH